MEKKINNNIESLVNAVLLDKDTVLFEKQEQGKNPTAVVRYSSQGEFYEDKIAPMNEDTIIEYNELMVAVFKSSGKRIKRPKLVTVYDVKRHEFSPSELLKLDYGGLSYQGAKVKTLKNNK